MCITLCSFLVVLLFMLAVVEVALCFDFGVVKLWFGLFLKFADFCMVL